MARDGYAWWYVDALSDDGAHALTLIAFIGSVFSPYYAAARRRAPADPEQHVAFNVALYGAGTDRWAMTERGRQRLQRDADHLRIGPSGLHWQGGALCAEIDEWCVPWPRRLRGRLRLGALALPGTCFALDAAARHRWQVWAQALVAYGELDNVSLFKNLSARFGLGSVTGASLLPMMLAFAAVTLCGVLLAAMALGRREWRGWLPSAIVVGFTVATALVIVPRAYSLKQVLVCAWPYGVLLTAWALDEVRALDPRRARMLAGASAGLSLVACAFTFMTPRADWRGVSAHFINHASPYTRVILDPPYNGQPWSFYRQPGGAAVVQTDGNDTGLLERLATAGSDLCLVAERFGAAPPTSKTEAWLDQHVPLTSTTRFSRLEVRCYRAPATLPSGE